MNPTEATQAAAKAVEFFRAMHPDAGVSDIRVEEIELSPDEMEWHVTIGFARPAPSHSAQARLARLMGTDPAGDLPKEMDYKRISLRKDDLEVTRMAIRETVS